MGGHKGRVGVDDFVLLSEISEEAFLANLAERTKADEIYTYIGEVLVSMNPYKRMDALYGKNKVDDYKGRYMYERPPHVFALADHAFRSLLRTQENQCIVISGESGAGKTEASKLVMQYFADVSPPSISKELAQIREKLVDSTPLLESFGNAKTLRNDNSSRFGKYMQVQFDFTGAPVGGPSNRARW